MMLNWLRGLVRPSTADARAAARYAEIVAIARRPFWYAAGGVADDIDGRFDMVVLALALYVIRLEREVADPRARAMSTTLVERFIADMDGSFREIGIGDMVIGKHMGRSLQALGGRLGSYRSALASDAPAVLLGEALHRNLYRGADVAVEARDSAEAAVRAEWQRLSACGLEEFLA